MIARVPLKRLRVTVLVLAGTLAVDRADARPDEPSLTGDRDPVPVEVVPGDDWNSFSLRRASGLWSRGDVEGAVEALLGRDAGEDRDARAGFLLAYGRHRLGDDAGAGRIEASSEYRDWLTALRFLGRMNANGAETSDAAGKLSGESALFAAELSLRGGRAEEALRLLQEIPSKGSLGLLADALTVRAYGALERDPSPVLARLAKRSPVSALDRALVSAARVRLATTLLAEGADPTELLEDLAPDLVYFPRARHMLGQAALEAGRVEEGRAILTELVARHGGYPRAREALRALGFLAIRESRWEDAYRELLAVEKDWNGERDVIERLSELAGRGEIDLVWDAWVREGERPGTLVLDPAPIERALEEVARESLDLHATPKSRLSAGEIFRVSAGLENLPPSLPTPEPERRRAEAEVSRDLARADRELRRARRDLERQEAGIERERTYYELGLERADDAFATLREVSSRIEALAVRGEEIVALYGATKDAALRRIARRMGEFVETARETRTLVSAIDHFRGAGSPAGDVVPQGVPTVAELLAEERELLVRLESWFATFERVASGRVRDSHDHLWVPRATGILDGLSASARLESDRASRVRAAVDSTHRAATSTSRLAAARAEIAHREKRTEELTAHRSALRLEIVEHALGRARASLASQGEGIAYALAVSTHELAVETARGLEASDSPAPESKFSRDAARRYEEFLARYPDSPARSEIRYRLADALMQAARSDFHFRIRGFFGGSEETAALDRAALAPFVDYGPALEQYLLVLDDPDFAHRDAALFHAGMILSDDGDSRAARHLRELVERFPGSEHAQEAHLRLGDELFLNDEFAACLPHFERAAEGPDPEHAQVALYKTGWAYFNEDRFDEAAQAFARLLVADGSDAAPLEGADLAEEAEDYLVHSLARAGGAEAFERLFGDSSLGSREAKALTRLGHLLRRFSQFGEATATDSLFIARYPDDPGALDAAERLVATLERAGDTAGARTARLQYAEHFLAGTDWFAANDSEPARERARVFASSSFKRVAVHHHHEARGSGQAHDWRPALELYEKILDEWPEHAGADTIHYYAGEAAAALRDFPRAVAHYEAVSAFKSSPNREDAAWQAVAVRDAWYESTRDGSHEESLGSDELARALIDAIDVWEAPDETRSADLLWRKGNLAYAHGWLGVAADAFEDLASRHPDDARAIDGGRLRARAFYETERFEEASFAYESAADAARAAGADSLAASLDPLVPHCLYRDAEGRGATKDAARRFESLALRFPSFEHADRALYRAGLAFEGSGASEDAVRVWSVLLEAHPSSDYVRDAHLEIANAWEREGRAAEAARALRSFSEAFPDDEDASAAMLRGIDLLSEGDDVAGAETFKTRYLEMFPEDVDTTIEIVEERARRELDRVAPEHGISELLEPETNLSRYLELAETNRDKVSPAILAEIQFRRGEDARGPYDLVSISQPLGPSVAKKKALLEGALDHYRQSAEYAIAPWNRAAAYRIGECLVAFGDALLDSERPRGLSADELDAYEEVLEEQSYDFFDKGEEAWTELLRRSGGEHDRWHSLAKENLWPRLAARFLHSPELEYPLVPATEAEGGDE